MPTVLSVVLSLFGLYIVQLLLDLQKVARDVGWVCLVIVDRLTIVNFGVAICLVHDTSSSQPLLLRGCLQGLLPRFAI